MNGQNNKQLKTSKINFSRQGDLLYELFSSQVGWRQDLHADPEGAGQHPEQSDQVVRLSLANTEILRRGESN